MESPEAAWVAMMVIRLEKLEQDNVHLRSRLSKLEPPSEHYDMQFHPRSKDIFFEVPVYMDRLPSLNTLGRYLMRQEGVTALTLLPAVQEMDWTWTVQDDRLKGSLEGIVEYPCTAHQLTAAIFTAWKDFLVPEKGFSRLVECQAQFWAKCAFKQDGSWRWRTRDHVYNYIASDGRAYLHGAVQDDVIFHSSAANEAAESAIASLETFNLRFGDSDGIF